MPHPPTAASPTAVAVVLAGGSGTRLGAGHNKVYLPLAGRRVITWSFTWLRQVTEVTRFVLVIRPEDTAIAREVLEREVHDLAVELVVGGTTRHASELNALRHLAPSIRDGTIDVVVVHDGARPLCGAGLMREAVRTARLLGGAVPGIPARDLLPAGPATTTGASPGTRPRRGMPAGTHRVQTPQAFLAEPLLSAYEQAAKDGYEGSDTACTVERYTDLRVQLMRAEPSNIKVTYPQDLFLAEQVLARARYGLA